MSDREIQEKLLKYYECIKTEIQPLRLPAAKKFLFQKDVHFGMCYCAKTTFHVIIYGATWTQVDFPYPFFADSKRQLIARLDKRINYLKSLLSK